MKNVYIFYLPFLIALYLIPLKTLGQQNFFNVPSSDITQKNKVFFQQQFNMFREGVQSNTTLNYGLGKNFEIGVNYIGLTVLNEKHFNLVKDDTLRPYFPYFAINGHKRISLSEHFAFSYGFQVGLTTTHFMKTGGYTYLNSVYDNEHLGLKAVLGAYCASTSYFGEEDYSIRKSKYGIQAGVEKHLVRDKLLLQIDYISGHHNLSQAVIGGGFYLTKRWILSAGYQIPNLHSRSVRALVIELTYNHRY